MKLSSLIEQIKLKKSYLCVGIDPDLDKVPVHIRNQKDPIYTFSKSIIDWFGGILYKRWIITNSF